MSDMIDRWAAIGLIHSLYPSAPIMRINRKRWEKKYKPYMEAEKALEQLPSAQPEIIHCRDCKHRGEKPIADGRYWCEIHDTFMYYCSDAERRTDE